MLCPHGVVCRCRLRWAGEAGYTGLFRGEHEALLRLSSALQPTAGWNLLAGSARRVPFLPQWPPYSFTLPIQPPYNSHSSGYSAAEVRTARSASKLFPCAAIKAFRAGGPSANLLFAGRKVGQQEAGFLAHALCTHATEKAAAPLQHVVERLRQHSRWPTHTGLSDFAAEEAPSGERDRGAGRVVFPWCLVLQPLWHGLQEKISYLELILTWSLRCIFCICSCIANRL